MARIVDINEAKTQLSGLLELAHAGQEIILTKAGMPYVRLMPVPPEKGQRRPGRLQGRVGDDFFDSLPE